MNRIKDAKATPIVEYGAIKWYYGETFDFAIELNVVDQDGAPVELMPDDKLRLQIYDHDDYIWWYTDVTGLESGSVMVPVDEKFFTRFERGVYKFMATLTHGGHRKVIAHDVPVHVI